jgi:large subunit ribosomal protein L24
MKIKKGDKVIVLTGKDKGKSGKVLRALPKKSLVLVEGVNIKKKHERKKRENQKGQIIDKTMPIHVSNVMLLGDNGKPTKVAFKKEGEKRIRISKSTKTAI